MLQGGVAIINDLINKKENKITNNNKIMLQPDRNNRRLPPVKVSSKNDPRYKAYQDS